MNIEKINTRIIVYSTPVVMLFMIAWGVHLYSNNITFGDSVAGATGIMVFGFLIVSIIMVITDIVLLRKDFFNVAYIEERD